MECVGDDELLATSEFKAESFHGSSPLFVCIWYYLGIPVSLDDEEVLPILFLYDILEVFIDDLSKFIIIFRRWSISLEDRDVEGVSSYADGYDSAADKCAVDD